MTSKVVAARLADMGFAYDESVTCKTHYWAGTIDPIGAVSIGGECRGVA
jgi:Fe2+ transport system protein FeoA